MGNCIISHGGGADKLKPKAFYCYGGPGCVLDPVNNVNGAISKNGYQAGHTYWLAEAPSKTAIPVLKPMDGSGQGNIAMRSYAYQWPNTYTPSGAGWRVISHGDSGSGTKTWNMPAEITSQPEVEWTIACETYNDEDTSGRYGNIRIKLNGVWYTPAEAVAEKLVKPMFLIAYKYWSANHGNVEGLYNGGNNGGNADWESGMKFGFMTNKKVTCNAIQFYTSYMEHGWIGYCATDEGRWTYNNKNYSRSQYKEKYW